MPYTPDATDVTNPADVGVQAATAAAEFRALKRYVRDSILAPLGTKAPSNNPVFTGTVSMTDATLTGNITFSNSPVAPTPPFGDATNKLATMAAIAAASLSATVPGAATGRGMSITSDGISPYWGFSSAEAAAIMVFLGG